MTNEQDKYAPVEVRSDGLLLSDILRAAAESREESIDPAPFWASPERDANSEVKEILDLRLGSPKRINHISCEISRFPLQAEFLYLDESGEWQQMRLAIEESSVQPPLKVLNTSCAPRVVNSADSVGHPQHFGGDHWRREAWHLVPFTTSRIRVVIQRVLADQVPVNPLGQEVAYSVAMRRTQIGYRVKSRKDLPSEAAAGQAFASSTDLVGSRVTYSLYEQSPSRVLDGDVRTTWRSEPQPVNYAVVPLYFDLRDGEGTIPLVDRWYVDPLTSGVTCNVYVSDFVPEGDFRGSSSPVPSEHVDTFGRPISPIYNPGPDPERLGLALTGVAADKIQPGAPEGASGGPVGFSISSDYLSFSPRGPWWLGMEYVDPISIDADPTAIRPILDVSGVSVYRHGQTLRISGPGGALGVIPVTPEVYRPNISVRISVSYHPDDPVRLPYLRLAARFGNRPVESVEVACDLDLAKGPIQVGRTTRDPEADTILILRSMVLKEEESDGDEFLRVGLDYTTEPIDGYRDDSRIRRAILRMNPAFYDADTNRLALVGGPGERFDQAIWRPLARDHDLRQGFLQVPPTKSQYWKFEFTGLVPRIFESFLPIDREVLYFPPDVVEASEDTGPRNSSESLASGVSTTKASDRSGEQSYVDALRYLRSVSEGSDNQVLVIDDPDLAAEAAETGWIWQFQPWHSSPTAPQFTHPQQHRYEKIRIRHQTKVGFFVGLKELRPYRVDYLAEDDTPEYEETFLDQVHILSMDGLSPLSTGGVVSTVPRSEMVSKTFRSTKKITGVQYATQETGLYPVSENLMSDPEMEGISAYGDASIRWKGNGDVEVERNVAARHTYRILEAQTYGDLDGQTYGDIEGNTSPASSDGGVTTRSYSLSGSGNMVGYVDVSAVGNLDGLLLVEMVSTYGDKVGASVSRRLFGGERARIRVEFPPGSNIERITWGQVENYLSERAQILGEVDPVAPTTYGDLEAFSYGEMESGTVNDTQVYLRVRQRGGSSDSFIVHEMSLYDVPIVWYFSNDGGTTWHQSVGVRNDPNGVLRFPEEGRDLRWKCEVWRKDASISALYIRPWYGVRHSPEPSTHELQASGPNLSAWDNYPPIHMHPAWASGKGEARSIR